MRSGRLIGGGRGDLRVVIGQERGVPLARRVKWGRSNDLTRSSLFAIHDIDDRGFQVVSNGDSPVEGGSRIIREKAPRHRLVTHFRYSEALGGFE